MAFPIIFKLWSTELFHHKEEVCIIELHQPYPIPEIFNCAYTGSQVEIPACSPVRLLESVYKDFLCQLYGKHSQCGVIKFRRQTQTAKRPRAVSVEGKVKRFVTNVKSYTHGEEINSTASVKQLNLLH